jgi:hypothetical protein
LDNGDLLVIGAEPWGRREPGIALRIPDSTRYVARLDPESRAIWKRKLNAHHDVDLLPDGRIAVLTFERRRIPGIHPDIDTRDDGIAFLDPSTGDLLETWGFLDVVARREDIFPPELGSINDLGGEKWVDLFHSNSMEWLAPGVSSPWRADSPPGLVLVTFRHQDRLAVFDGARREALWAWGQGILDGPHDGQLLPSGTILLFDNGLARGWSRVVEVNPVSGAVTWEWKGQPPASFYSPSKGSVERLPNGNTLIAESDRGRAAEVSPEGRLVWEFLCPYRPNSSERHAIGAIRLKSPSREE